MTWAWFITIVLAFSIFGWYVNLFFGGESKTDKEVRLAYEELQNTNDKSSNNRRSPAAKARKKGRSSVPNAKGRGRKASKGMSGRVIEWADGRRTVL